MAIAIIQSTRYLYRLLKLGVSQKYEKKKSVITGPVLKTTRSIPLMIGFRFRKPDQQVMTEH